MVKLMIKNLDIEKYFAQNSSLKEFTKLSENKQTRKPLVNNNTLAYDYEACSTIWFKNDQLKMVDALYIKNNDVFFIEFKGGFVINIRDDNFNWNEWWCEDAQKICKDTGKIFLENQKLKISELFFSITGKLIETSATIKSIILPSCMPCQKVFKTHYVVVVNEMSKPLEAMENSLNELSNTPSSTTNPISNLKKAIKKYKLLDSNNEGVFFDNIEVWNTDEFNQKIH